MTEAQTQPQTVVAFDEVKNLVGKSLGHSAWREITQEQVNTFADATDDHQAECPRLLPTRFFTSSKATTVWGWVCASVMACPYVVASVVDRVVSGGRLRRTRSGR